MLSSNEALKELTYLFMNGQIARKTYVMYIVIYTLTEIFPKKFKVALVRMI